MECLIRVIQGPDQGAHARLLPGQNIVGRSHDARLRLEAPDVSWEHLVLTRNGDDYYAENLSAAGTFSDGGKITGQVRLRPREVLRLTPDTAIRLEALDGSDLLGRRRLLIAALAVVAGGSIALLALNPFSEPPAANDWDKAYRAVHRWVQNESTARRLPETTPVLFQQAWRLEQSENFDQSRRSWLRLQVLLDAYDSQMHFSHHAADNPQALDRLLVAPENDPHLTEDQAAAAFAQFVQRRLRWSSQQAQQQRGRW